MFHSFFSENRTVYEIMWGKYGRAVQATDENIIRRMRTASCLTEASDRHLGFEIIIYFP